MRLGLVRGPDRTHVRIGLPPAPHGNSDRIALIFIFFPAALAAGLLGYLRKPVWSAALLAAVLVAAVGIVAAAFVRYEDESAPSASDAAYFGFIVVALVSFGWAVGRLTSYVLIPAGQGADQATGEELSASPGYAVALVLLVSLRWAVARLIAPR